MPDHNEFFRRDYEKCDTEQMRERPSTELKVRIRPNQNGMIPSQLATELYNDHNMDLVRSNSNRDIVIVSGIPPDNDFGEHEVLEVVRKYLPNAEIV